MKRNRLLMLSLSGLVVLSGLGVSFSMAWYVASSNLTISQIEIGVVGEKNLMVSDNPDNFEEHDEDNGTTSLELKSSIKGDFKPVSSMYSYHEDYYTDSTWIDRKETSPVFMDSFTPSNSRTPVKPLAATSGYFSQEIYLKADTDCYVTLDPAKCLFNGYIATEAGAELKNSSILEYLHKENLKAAKKIYGSSSTKDYEKWATSMDSLYKALRISILVPEEDSYQYWVIDPFKETVTGTDGKTTYKDTYFAGRLNIDLDEYYDNYFAENIDGTDYYQETIYGDLDESTRDKAVYGDAWTKTKSDSVTIDAYEKSSFNAKTQANTRPLDFQSSLDNGLIASKEHSVALVDQGDRESDVMIPVYMQKPTKIVLSIYLEGWDTDCVNNTMGANFLSTLSFMIAKEM
jgi:hypothetical protein